ncbi:MAG TPA: SAM-dependent chlorinase/fluorinase [Pirellulales bacterium]|jgi:hypothetical protein|nr:SAM-dependent chlorinase/fluorinase [Pirellulales bacterium]
MHNPIITLTTDFGVESPYVAAMKGVLLTLCRAATIVDITHAIPPQDVRQGAIVCHDLFPWFPPDTIHVGVVDPGVGSDRPLIYAELGTFRCLAPDNGLLSLLATRFPITRIVRLTKAEHWQPVLSATFHGRDILAPVAARLALGIDPAALGEPQLELVSLAWQTPISEPGYLQGKVLAIDTFGNLLTNITAEHLQAIPDPNQVTLDCHGFRLIGLARTYSDRSLGELVALLNSSGRLELAIVNGSAAQKTGALVGSEIEVHWPTV